MSLDDDTLWVYCPSHNLSFPAPRGSTVTCQGGSHAFVVEFARGEFWEYCCDCQRFWPSEIGKTAKAKDRCPSCERAVARRSLCHSCGVLSLESDEHSRAQEFRIPAGRGVEPKCPGCLKPATAEAPPSHRCEETAMEFVTLRAECPFCEKPVAGAPRAAATTAALPGRACPGCGKQTVEGARFCGACGTVLGAAKPAPPGSAASRTPVAARADGATAGATAASDAEKAAKIAAAKAKAAALRAAAADDRHAANEERHAAAPGNGVVKLNSLAPTFTPTPRVDAAPATRHVKVNNLIALLALVVVLAVAVVGAVVFMRRQGEAETPPGNVATKEPPRPAPSGAVATPPRMAFVAGGVFTMGSTSGDEFERPPHRRTVAPFYIDLYEVTCEEYARFVKATNHAPPPGWAGAQPPAGAAQQPVTGVNWDDANAYAKWAGKRLPTEEEWEFAARGADGRRYPWGNEWKVGLANAGGGSSSGVADVGTFKGTSPFGAFDMSGNAWEWTASEARAYPGGRLPEDDYSGSKVIRGGFWGSSPAKATATFRRGWPVSGEDYSNTSFRCVMDVKK